MANTESMKILVTGGAGFIGSNFIRHMLAPGRAVELTNLDCLTYAGNPENLIEIEGDPRYRFVKVDISDTRAVESAMDYDFDAIINFAAETHVDRSIVDSSQFVRTNVLGTQVLLDVARKGKIPRFVQVSTDEVYGTLGETGKFTEQTPLAPNSPYSASKASADLLVRAYHETYGMNTVITRCSNNYGPFQFPEKLIPLMVLNALEEKPLPVYGDGLNVRDWLFVPDHCRALEKVLLEGRPGRIYNIGGNQERKNLEVVEAILEILGKPRSLIRYVKDRPGHDRRYAIDSTRIQEELGWIPEVSFEQGLEKTVNWYREHHDWVNRVRSGQYLNYYRKMYENREQTLSDL